MRNLVAMGRNKQIENKQSGIKIIFLQTAAETNGQLLEMEAIYRPNSSRPVEHYHPFQQEKFNVLEGELTALINGSKKTLRKGDELELPANTVHTMWNHTSQPTIVNWKVMPALRTESFLESFAVLSAEHPRLSKLQAAVTVNYFSKEFRLSKPNFVIQRILFTALSAVAYLKGLRAVHRQKST